MISDKRRERRTGKAKCCGKIARYLGLILALCIVFSVLSAETLIADSLYHDCSEPGCRPCRRIEIARSFLKTFKLASVNLLVVTCLALLAGISINHLGFNICPLSPLVLKVRLNS